MKTIADMHSAFDQVVQFSTSGGKLMSNIHKSLVVDRMIHITQLMAQQPSASSPTARTAIAIDFHSADWRDYAGWLYGHPVQNDTSIEKEDGWEDMDELFKHLLDLYHVGDTLQDVLFQDEVVNAMLALLKRDGKRLYIDDVLPRLLGLGPVMELPRQLMVDFRVSTDSVNIGDCVEACMDETQDGQFCRAINQALLEKLAEGGGQAPWTQPCKYHKHENACHLASEDGEADAETR